MSTKPKAPRKPVFGHVEPTKPKGETKKHLVCSFNNEDLHMMNIKELDRRVLTSAKQAGIDTPYEAFIVQDYASSEVGYVEFSLNIVYEIEEAAAAETDYYMTKLDEYDKAKLEYEKTLEAYEKEKEEYDRIMLEFNRKEELDVLTKLAEKHGYKLSA